MRGIQDAVYFAQIGRLVSGLGDDLRRAKPCLSVDCRLFGQRLLGLPHAFGCVALAVVRNGSDLRLGKGRLLDHVRLQCRGHCLCSFPKRIGVIERWQVFVHYEHVAGVVIILYCAFFLGLLV